VHLILESRYKLFAPTRARFIHLELLLKEEVECACIRIDTTLLMKQITV